MSIKTPQIVTRRFAIAAIMLKIHEATDEQLEDMLESAIHNGFYNFCIVDEQQFEDNKKEEYPRPYLPDYNDAH